MTLTRRSRPLFSLCFFLVAIAAARSAQAQAPSATTIDAQLFQTAIGPRNFLTVEGAEVPEHKRLSFGLTLNYQRHPYSTFTTGTTEGTSYPIEHQTTGELLAAIGLFERFQLGVGVPYTFYLSGDIVDRMGVPTTQRLTENGIGDTRIEAKAQLATLGEDEQYSIAASAGITLPTSKAVDRPYYLGDKSVTGRIKAIGQAQLGPVRAAANLGLLFRGVSSNFATSVGNQLLYGLAAAYELDNRIEVILEAHGRSGLNEFAEFYTDVNPFEIDAAVRWGVTSMWSVMGGGGKGIGNGVGAPQTRLFVGAQFNPDFRDRDHDGVYDIDDKCPDQPEDRDGFNDKDGCPDLDNDNDGIPDAQDKCANDAEDLDQVDDEDGCPDPDNDKDGVPDLNDPCPNAAEDGKGKRPKDGCPSSAEDSDGDGVGDPTDKCVDDPEDRDNFEDEDGCPDPDNDKDGFLDAQDKCPLQAETLNGNKDEDGCPDPGAEIVHLQLADGTGKITVDDRIGFGGGLKNGKPVLKESAAKSVGLVALVLKGHADIKKVRVEVRAEGVSKNETQARADAIKDALVAKGVDAARIEAVGAGGGARVDFIITEMAAPPKPAAEAPAAQ
jgi:hypothetical protein